MRKREIGSIKRAQAHKRKKREEKTSPELFIASYFKPSMPCDSFFFCHVVCQYSYSVLYHFYRHRLMHIFTCISFIHAFRRFICTLSSLAFYIVIVHSTYFVNCKSSTNLDISPYCVCVCVLFFTFYHVYSACKCLLKQRPSAVNIIFIILKRKKNKKNTRTQLTLERIFELGWNMQNQLQWIAPDFSM